MRERYLARNAPMFCWKPSAKVQSAYSAGISWSPGLAASSTIVSMYLRTVLSDSAPAGGPWPGTTCVGLERGQAVEDREPGLRRMASSEVQVRADADEVPGEEHAVAGQPHDRVARRVGGTALDRRSAPELALAGERLRRERELQARDLGDDSAALLALPLGRVLFLQFGQVRLHLLLHAGDAAGPGLGDRRRGRLRRQDRDVRKRLRAAVVVEVGVGDEQPLGRGGELLRRGAQVSRCPGREAAVDDEGAAAEVGDARVADAGAGVDGDGCPGTRCDLLEAVVVGDHASIPSLSELTYASSAARAFLCDLDCARADDDAVGQRGCGPGMLGRRDPETGVEGRSVTRRARSTRTARAGERSDRRARRPGEGDEIEPAVGLGRGEGEALLGRGRGDQLDTPELGPFSGGQVGDDHARRPRRSGHRPRSAPSRTPRAGTSTSSVRAAPRRASRVAARHSRQAFVRMPAASARSRGPPDHRPVRERIGEGKADLDQVGAARLGGRGQLRRVRAGHQVDDECLAHRRSSTEATVSGGDGFAVAGAGKVGERLVEVLVAAAREADDDHVALELGRAGERVGGLERGDDPLRLGQPAEGVERLVVGRRAGTRRGPMSRS